MPKINRNSIHDSKSITEFFIKEKVTREGLLIFLAQSISYANQLNSENWNLNLDKNGKFIRFNVGQEYCIEVFEKKVNILCLKEVLKKSIKEKQLNINFAGYEGKKKIFTNNLNKVPDCLAKVPDSVGCYMGHENLIEYLPLLKEANFKFIEYAINNTLQRPNMKGAHSNGFLEYLIHLGMFEDNNLITEKKYIELQENELLEAKKLDVKKLKQKATKAIKLPKKIEVSVIKYIRNQYVAEYAKKEANGICQDCKNPAPFINRSNGELFLETHHIIPLAEGGEDTIENTIAICPNCHRKRHYG